MIKLKSNYSAGDIDYFKDEIDKSLATVARIDFFLLEDEISYKTNMAGLSQPYIISSIEEKLASTTLVLEDTTDQLKAIKNIEGPSDYINLRCATIQEKVKELQDFYKDKTTAETTHRFKEYAHTTAKGKVVNIRLEASTKEQQVKVRSSIQKKLLKIITTLDIILQAEDKKTLRRGEEIPERMTFKTESRK
jgi:hypothetical protein